tara:strand:+ start:153 stop:530 length:378 start_codon:yes stop_codon:yes gene_type:complete
MKKSKYKAGDIVLVKSPAGDAIPQIHVKLLKRVVVDAVPSRLVGFRSTMDWPGYAGWEATPVFQSEIDVLRKEWSIPLAVPHIDETFVYDDCIVKRPRNPTASPKPSRNTPARSKKRQTILRKKK